MRIEDIDPPREPVGAADAIRFSLEAHGLFWDGEVRYQSQRSDTYHALLYWLKSQDLIYACNCTRARLTPLQGRYDGHCRTHLPPPNEQCALRLKVDDLPPAFSHISSFIKFEDRVYGKQEEDLATCSGDFVIHRKDGLFAYQLAVVADDIDQKVTNIVRGDDLLETTARQIFLYRILQQDPPSYGHIPVIRDTTGKKLSKQNHAPALDNESASQNVRSALSALGYDFAEDTIENLLSQAIESPSFYLEKDKNGFDESE